MAQDAQLISQASKVESLASDGLVSVSTGAGQPQKNMELAKFADSLGSSVPLQQNAEQVGITGLYARTSEGKMVELTKESVASVMSGLMGHPIGARGYTNSDMNSIINSGTYNCHNSSDPDVVGNLHYPYNSRYWILNVYVSETWITQTAIRVDGSGQYYIRKGDMSGNFSAWTRIDNFGYNSLEELSAGVAEKMCCTSYKGFSMKGASSVTVNFSTNNVPRRYACMVVVRFTSPGFGALTFVASGYGASSSRNSVNIIGSPTDSISVTFADDLEGFVISNSSNSDAVIDMFQFGENLSSPTLT